MTRQRRDWVRGDGGQAVVLLALGMTTLLLAVGLAIDAGTLFVARQTMQVASDGAAWAGAVKLYEGGSAAAARQAALDDAARNGFATTGAAVVTVTTPPSSGAFAGDPGYVEVTIQDDARTRFIPGAAAGLTRIMVRSVGGASPITSAHAILSLSASDPQAFRVSGNGNLNITGGAIKVNSSAPNDAALLSGNGTVYAPSGTSIVGGLAQSGQAAFTPAATTGSGVAAKDPYRFLQTPSVSGLPTFTDTQISAAGSYVLTPGVYVNGIRVSASDAHVKLRPGTYILKGGGLQVSGTSYVCAVSSTYGAVACPASTVTTSQVLGVGGATIGPDTMTGIAAGTALRVDSGSSQEDVTVTSATATTFNASFTKTHGPANTTATTGVTAGTVVAVTPVSMTGIVVGSSLKIDDASRTEVVSVISVSATSFTAFFAQPHGPSSYPVRASWTIKDTSQETGDAGVLIFNTHSAYPSTPVGTCGKIQISGDAVLELRARSSGQFAGMLIYQDRNCATTDELLWSGNGQLTIASGVIYVPTATVHISGNGTGNFANAQIVSDEIHWSGNGNLNLAYGAGTAGRPTRPALVE